VLCLPAHTTHHLQPLDVGIFGPLNSTLSHTFNRNAIKKTAFAPALNTTTQAAQPVPAAIPELIIAVAVADTEDGSNARLNSCTLQDGTSAASAAPSHSSNTTTSTSSTSNASTASGSSASSAARSASETTELKFILKNVPRLPLDRACFQMERDYALKVLMDKENERLRARLYDKSRKPSKKTSGYA